jgi:hypothetical protein
VSRRLPEWIHSGERVPLAGKIALALFIQKVVERFADGGPEHLRAAAQRRSALGLTNTCLVGCRSSRLAPAAWMICRREAVPDLSLQKELIVPPFRGTERPVGFQGSPYTCSLTGSQMA